MVGTAAGQDFYFLAPGLYTSDIHTRTDKDTHTHTHTHTHTQR